MDSMSLLLLVVVGALIILASTVTANWLMEKYDDWQFTREVDEVLSIVSEPPVELYGPLEDRMSFPAFLDFWMLLTDDQKTSYAGQNWIPA